MLSNYEGLVGDARAEGSFGFSDREIGEFWILRGGSKAKCKITTLDFRRDDFGLFICLEDSHGTRP